MRLHGLAILATVLGVHLIVTLSTFLWHATETRPKPHKVDSSPVDGTVLSTDQAKGTPGDV